MIITMNKKTICPQCGYVHLGVAQMIAHIFTVIGYKELKVKDTLNANEIKAIYDYLIKTSTNSSST